MTTMTPEERAALDAAEAQVAALVDRVQAEWYNGNMDEGAMDRILSDTPDEWMEQHDADVAQRAVEAALTVERVRMAIAECYPDTPILGLAVQAKAAALRAALLSPEVSDEP